MHRCTDSIHAGRIRHAFQQSASIEFAVSQLNSLLGRTDRQMLVWALTAWLRGVQSAESTWSELRESEVAGMAVRGLLEREELRSLRSALWGWRCAIQALVGREWAREATSVTTLVRLKAVMDRGEMQAVQAAMWAWRRAVRQWATESFSRSTSALEATRNLRGVIQRCESQALSRALGAWTQCIRAQVRSAAETLLARTEAMQMWGAPQERKYRVDASLVLRGMFDRMETGQLARTIVTWLRATRALDALYGGLKAGIAASASLRGAISSLEREDIDAAFKSWLLAMWLLSRTQEESQKLASAVLVRRIEGVLNSFTRAAQQRAIGRRRAFSTPRHSCVITARVCAHLSIHHIVTGATLVPTTRAATWREAVVYLTMVHLAVRRRPSWG
eukprot:4293404-Prymnesium_polylepis.1